MADKTASQQLSATSGKENINDLKNKLLATIDNARIDLERLSMGLKSGKIEESHEIAQRAVATLHAAKEQCSLFQSKIKDLVSINKVDSPS